MANSTFVRVYGVARVVQDPRVREVNGKTVCNVRVAVQREFGKDENGQPVSDFFDLTVWDRGKYEMGKYAGESLRKGALVSFESHELPVTKPFTGRDGQQREQTSLRVWDVHFMERRPTTQEGPSINGDGGVPAADLVAVAAQRSAPGEFDNGSLEVMSPEDEAGIDALLGGFSDEL